MERAIIPHFLSITLLKTQITPVKLNGKVQMKMSLKYKMVELKQLELVVVELFVQLKMFLLSAFALLKNIFKISRFNQHLKTTE